MRIDEILDYNERFLQKTQLPIIGHAPRKNLAVVTCMDCRLVQMFEQALGLVRRAGVDNNQPRNAGVDRFDPMAVRVAVQNAALTIRRRLALLPPSLPPALDSGLPLGTAAFAQTADDQAQAAGGLESSGLGPDVEDRHVAGVHDEER